jgi:HNH endonuclease
VRIYCPRCGASFTLFKRREVRAARMEKWVRHVWNCAKQDLRWKQAGTNAPSGLTFWQGKRYAAIRDSVLGDDVLSPWTRHPVCQGCGSVKEGTVDSLLHGRADGFDVQHILPRYRGGSNDPRNLAILCHPCHLRTFKRGYGGVPGRESPTRAFGPTLEAWT